MRRLCLLLVSLLITGSASAQGLVIHGHPQKAAYVNWVTEAPAIDFQVHWKPGNDGTNVCPVGLTLTPGLAHMHTQVTAPWWAELTATDTLTLPVVLKMFCTAGELVEAHAIWMGEWNEKEATDANGNSALAIAAPSWPYHIRGNPSGLVQIPGTLTFNFTQGLDVGVPKHGWGRIAIEIRVKYDNGDLVTSRTILSFYSMIDPTAPEVPTGEAGINLAVRAAIQSARDHDSEFASQLTEFKTMLPILAPISTPQLTDVNAYNYGDISRFPTAVYEMLIDPDLHMGIPGTPQATVHAGTLGNLDTWYPATIAASTPPMGLPPGVHKIGFSWLVDTGNGFTGSHGGQMSAGERLVTLITVPVTIGPNATNSGPVTSWAPVLVPPPPPPVVLPPPPPPPPPPTWHSFTPTFSRLLDSLRVCDPADSACLTLGTVTK